MKKIYRDILILTGIFAMVWLVFSLWSGRWTDGDHTLLSQKNTRRMQHFMREQFFETYDSISQPDIDSTVAVISARLLAGLDRPFQDTLHVFIIDDSRINAFATLGGDMYIFSGLIRFVDSPEMLAAVMAHELGHLVNGDLEKRIEKEIGISVIFAVLSGGDPGTAAQLSKTMMTLHYDRRQERQADAFAGHLLERARLDPGELTRFFLKLQAEDRGNIPEGMSIFATHPALKERIVLCSEHIRPDSVPVEKFTVNWDTVQEHLGAH